MITLENVTIYRCDFCAKELKRKHAMLKHEEFCKHNPKNIKACHWCNHLETIDKEVFFENKNYHQDYDNNEGEWKVKKVFRCKKFDILMFPFSIEKKGLHKEYTTFEDQEPMPNECNDFEEQNYFF